MEQYVLLALVVLSRCCLVYLQPPCEEFKEPPPPSVEIELGGRAVVGCGHGEYATRFSRVETDSKTRGKTCNCALNEGKSLGNKISFVDVTRETSGLYGCWAFNENDILMQCYFEVTVRAPPVIFLDDDPVINGKSLTITPYVDFGVPKANITWFHTLNDITVTLDPSTDNRVRISDEGVLTVRNVEASDRGTYTIRGFNGAEVDAVASTGVNLNFLEFDNVTFKVVGTRVRVMCGAVAYPGPLRVSVLPSPNQFITDTYTTMFEERLSVSYIYDSCSSRESYQCAVNAGELNLTAAGSTDCEYLSGVSKLSRLHIASLALICVTPVLILYLLN